MAHEAFPPLNALRAFEAAAKHESLVDAADALGVTPSAVGHQVRALETFLGVRLFDRRARGLRLTATGAHFAAKLSQGFEAIAQAVQVVKRKTVSPVLTVSATPSLALRWLAPNLNQFRDAYPTYEFVIDASSRPADLARGEADLDVRYGRVVDPSLHVDVLFEESVFPVCARARLADLSDPLAPADLANAERLQVDDWGARGGVWRCWEDWFHLAGIKAPGSNKGARFAAMDQAVAAAANGQGFAFAAQRHLQDPPLAEQLVRPFSESLSVTYRTFLVCLPEVAENRHVRVLRDWIVNLARSQDPSIIHRGAF